MINKNSFKLVDINKRISERKSQGTPHNAGINVDKFDPEGSDYDYETAKEAGIIRDETGHMASRDPRTGMLLKGRGHETFKKGVKVDVKLGYKFKKIGNRYYTLPTERVKEE